MKLQINKIIETSIYVSDLDQTSQFYHTLLGLPIITRKENRHVFFRAGDSVLLCFIADSTKNDENLPPHFGSGQIHFAFEVADRDYSLWKTKLQDSGISIEQEVKWKNGIESFYCRDPDNNLVEFILPGLWK